jgi:hypothetical protein
LKSGVGSEHILSCGKGWSVGGEKKREGCGG